MSVNCRIINNQVLAPNQNPSLLYQALENKFGEDKAMELYTLTETEKYKDAITITDSNGEMLLDDFLKFSLYKPQQTNFTQEVIDLQLRVGKEGLKNLKESVYKNGILIIDEQTLNDSNVFQKDEIINILNNPETLQNLEAFIQNSEELEINVLEDEYLVFENEYNSIGIKPLKNPETVKKEVLTTLSEANTVEEVNTLINTIEYPSIIKKFKEDGRYRGRIIQDVLDTSLVERQYDSNHVENILLNTLDVTRLDEISQISNSILNLENRDLINEEFLNLVDSLRISGLDIEIDTYQAYNLSEGQIKQVAQSLLNFSEKPDSQNIKSLAISLESVMNLPTEELINTSNISSKVNNPVYIETELNEIEIFEKKGFIKHGENVYQKIDDRYSTNQLYEILYTKLLNGNVQIPTPSIENQEQLQEPLNKEVVLQDIKDYSYKQTKKLPNGQNRSLEKVAIYKTYYEAKFDKASAKNPVLPVPNSEYLENDFPSDFSKFLNYNKDVNSQLYKSLLQFFKVDDKGIRLISNSEYTMSHVQNNLDLLEPRIKEDLQNYSRISKNLDLNLPAQTSENMLETDYKRMQAVQNPQTIEEVQKDFVQVSESDILIKNAKEDFVRVGNSVYEKVNQLENMSLYSKLPTGNKNYYNTNIQRPESNYTYQDLEVYLKEENTSEPNQLVGSLGLEEINEKHFNC